MARVYETIVVLTLLSALVLGMTYILSALIDQDKSSLESLFSKLHFISITLYALYGTFVLTICLHTCFESKKKTYILNYYFRLQLWILSQIH